MKTIYFLFAALLVSQAVLAQPTTFSSRGPGGGGALFSPSFNPTDANELYLACDMSELFHSTDQGATWAIPDFRQIQSQKMASVQYCPSGVRFAIDGSTTNGTDNMRPMKSTDNGVTWKVLVNDATANNAYTIFADPANNQHVLMSDYNSMYFSNNGGTSFVTMYHTNNSGSGLALGGAFFVENNIFIGTNEGVIVSTNGGTSFDTAHINGIPSNEFIVSFTGAKQGSTIRFFCVTLSQVYAGITGADHDAYKNVYRSDWGSGMWTKVTSGIDVSAHPFYVSMSVWDINTAYLAGGSDNSAPTVYKTTDGGSSWNSVFQTSNNQNIYTGWSGQNGDRAWSYGEYALGFQVAPGDPTHAIITDLGFAHITTDGGTTWHAAYVPQSDWNNKGSATPKGRSYHSIGLENTTCWNIQFGDGNTMFGCYSDIQGTRSTDGGITWGFNYTGHTDNTMYHVIRSYDPTSPISTRSYGATSSVHDMYQSTTLTDARIDGGKGKVISSTDRGATWQLVHDFGHPVIWLCASPADPIMIYACVIHSTEGGIYVSHNANQGTNSIWTKLANPPRTEGHPLNIRALENGNLLASYSGRRTSNFTASSGVFLSTNSGASWEDRSDDKMKYWTWDVVVDPYDPTENTWYAGVYSGWGGQANGLGGLYKTTNAGVTWTLMKSLQGVTSITFSPSNADVMYVTSEVDGLWYCGNRHDISPTLSQVNSYPFRQPMRVFYNPGDSTELWVSSFGNGMRVGKTSEPTPPAKVTLVHPENHSKPIVKVNELPPHGLFLQWDKVEGASGYRLLLASDSLMQRIVISDSALTDTSMFFTALIDSTYWWKVAAKNELGWGPWSDEWTFSDVTYLDVKDDAVAKSIGLSLYPNPASNEVTVAFNLSEPDRVRIELFDELGRKQQEIASGMLEQGKHTFNMDVSRLIPGPYYLKFAMSNFYRTIPLVLTK